MDEGDRCYFWALALEIGMDDVRGRRTGHIREIALEGADGLGALFPGVAFGFGGFVRAVFEAIEGVGPDPLVCFEFWTEGEQGRDVGLWEGVLR